MDVDYLIIGQGLCGTFLSYYLQQAGKTVMVVDEISPFTASKVASGVINPVTGRRIVRTWRIEELLPFARSSYTEIGNHLGDNLLNECAVLDFHPSLQMKEAFEKRLPDESEFLHLPSTSNWPQVFNYHFDIGKVKPCLLVDLTTLIKSWRVRLASTNSLTDERFETENCVISEDQVTYKGIRASKIIFCDGVNGTTNPFFKNLPYSTNKGEAIIAKIPGLSRDYIYKQGISIVPWKDDLFWIGSTYEWNFTDLQTTEAFRQKVVNQLNYWLKLPFEIVDHIASVRPANMERRPFVGLHPKYSSVGILNGMGTKGCSLAPFFAKQLTDYLLYQYPIYPDADVRRFTKVLARDMN